MNNILRISTLSALLTALASAAGAQNVIFTTDNGVDKLTSPRNSAVYSNNFGQGVGFTNNTTGNQPYFGRVNQEEGGVSAANAVAQYDVFTFSGPTTSGPVNIAVHGNAFQDPAGVGSVSVYANIYNNTGTSAAPIFGANILNDVGINFTSNLNDRSDFLYTSTVAGTLASALTTNGSYIISFNPRSTGGVVIANVAVVDTVQGGAPQLTGFSAVNADSTNTTVNNFVSTAPLGFRILSAAPAAAPEPSSVVSLVLGTLVLGGLVARRRRSAAA